MILEGREEIGDAGFLEQGAEHIEVIGDHLHAGRRELAALTEIEQFAATGYMPVQPGRQLPAFKILTILEMGAPMPPGASRISISNCAKKYDKNSDQASSGDNDKLGSFCYWAHMVFFAHEVDNPVV